jgi:hypothetical protein
MYHDVIEIQYSKMYPSYENAYSGFENRGSSNGPQKTEYQFPLKRK